jgi:hypothetical protein
MSCGSDVPGASVRSDRIHHSGFAATDGGDDGADEFRTPKIVKVHAAIAREGFAVTPHLDFMSSQAESGLGLHAEEPRTPSQ